MTLRKRLMAVGVVGACVLVSTVSEAVDNDDFAPAVRVGNARTIEVPTTGPTTPGTTVPGGTTTSTTTTVPGTATTSTTTTSPGTATTSTTSVPGGVESGEGGLGVLLHAKSEFDYITAPTDAASWASLNELYDAMVVWSPYFDERLSLFEGTEYAYQNLYGLKVDSASDTRATDHPEWVLRTADGDPTYVPFACDAPGGCPQYAADLGNPDVQDAFVQRVQDLVALGYGGVMIDDVNLAWRISDVNGDRASPISPRTGEEMLLSEWRSAVITVVERLRAEFPDLAIMHNSIWFADQPTYNNFNVDRQIAAADIIMLERGANDPGLTGGNGAFSFAKFVQFIDRVHAHDVDVLLLDETATTEREQIFNLATGLLVSDGDDLVGTEDHGSISPSSYWDGFAIDLGSALGDYSESGGVWRRHFEQGIVVVREPGSGAIEVDLGGQYVDASGSTVSGVVLDGREAAILIRP